MMDPTARNAARLEDQIRLGIGTGPYKVNAAVGGLLKGAVQSEYKNLLCIIREGVGAGVFNR